MEAHYRNSYEKVTHYCDFFPTEENIEFIKQLLLKFFNLMCGTMCNKRAIQEEYHFILECDRYIDIRRRYIKTYYYWNPSTFE